MFDIGSCPCCASPEATSYPALVAPFIADHALGSEPSMTSLMECRACGFRFFSTRLDEEEIGRLYAQYRGPDYVRTRNRHEFWYDQKFSDGIGVDTAEVQARRAATMDFLRSHVDPAGIRHVLDFGGDRGQFIPLELGVERSVFEISGLDTVDGVDLIPTKEALFGRKFDLVMLENVLEHSSDPAALLDELRIYARDAGSTYLFSVPFEPCALGLVPTRGFLRRLYERFLGAILKRPILCSLIDFYSLVFRLKLKVLPPLGFMKLHEHLNFFNESALRALLKRQGYTVLGFKIVPLNKFAGYSASILCLARAEPPSSRVTTDLSKAGARVG